MISARRIIGFLLATLLTTPSMMENARADTAKDQPETLDDKYLWLEEVESPRALTWVRRENARTLAELEADPRFPEFQQAARQILEARDRIPGPVLLGGVVYNFWQDDQHVRGLLRRSSWSSYVAGTPEWEAVLDVDALAAREGVKWVTGMPNCLAPAYRRCLFTLSAGGKDAATLREFDLVEKRFVDAGFALPESKHDVAWLDADQLLVATDWGPGTLTPSGYPYIVKRWRRGEPLAAATEIFRGQPQDVGVGPVRLRDRDGSTLHMMVRHETFFESSYQVLQGDRLVPLPLPRRSTVRGLWSGELLIALREDWEIGGRRYANGSLVSFPVATFLRTGALDVQPVYVPDSRSSFQSFHGSHSVAYVVASENVVSRVYRYTRRDGRWQSLGPVATPPNEQVTPGHVPPDDDRAFFYTQGFVSPLSLFLTTGDGAFRKLQGTPPRFDASGLVVEQLTATARDGTGIPYFIVRPRALKFDGNAPTLLYGYGGFQVSETPVYSGTLGKLWLERGGVYVLANIRGGGEFGPAWHQAGLKTKRQVIYDDFVAVAENLIARKITRPRRLGIMGGSNGGLLMGVMLTQRPDLWNAVVLQVPLLDMLRYDRLLAGASWVDEYGSPAIPEERAFLAKISPYQNLKADASYPPPFFVTSSKDDRVHPAHARKMAARMAELGHPFYYYENIDGGHAAASDQRERAKRIALEFTYLGRRLMD